MSRKVIILTICLLAGRMFVGNISLRAEVIVLENGRTIEAKIVSRTSDTVILDIKGNKVTFPMSEIQDIRSSHGKFIDSEASITNDIPFDTLKVTYRITEKLYGKDGNIANESEKIETVYIDVVNNKRREETTVLLNYAGLKKESAIVNLFDGERLYWINNEMNLATYTPAESTYKLGLGYRQIDTGRQIVQDDFFGRSCHVYESKDSKYWVWNNLLLKEEIRIANRYLLTEVLEIQENIELDKSLFKIPEHIVVISQEDYVSDVKNLAESVMGKLKKEYEENEESDTSAHTGEFDARQRDLWNKSMEYMASLMTEADQNKIGKIKNNSDLSEEEKLAAIEKIEITMRYKKQVFEETKSKLGLYDIEKHFQMID